MKKIVLASAPATPNHELNREETSNNLISLKEDCSLLFLSEANDIPLIN